MMYTFKNNDFGNKSQVLKCECGAEILLIPDLQAMNYAIEKHVSEHENKLGEPEKNNKAAADRIRERLIAQVFEKASL